MGNLWSYNQATGVLTGTKLGDSSAAGYSGHGRGVNNTDAERERNIGPIPRGFYKVVAIYATHADRVRAGYSKNLGPMVIHLEPHAETNTFGRSDFRVHGDNSRGDRSASNGCIIMPRWVRNKFEVDDYIQVQL